MTRRPVECFHLSRFFLPRNSNSNNNNINNNSDRLDMRLVRNSWLSWERHFTEFTIHRKKLARPFYKSKSEKTHLQTLHWSLSIGEVKLGLTRYKFVWESQIVFGGVCITISVLPVLMNMKCVFDNFYSPPSNGCQWRRFFPHLSPIVKLPKRCCRHSYQFLIRSDQYCAFFCFTLASARLLSGKL